MSLINSSDLVDMGNRIAAACGTITGKSWGVRLHDCLNRDTDTANNADGITRFIVFSALEYDSQTAHTPVVKLTWRLLCDGLAATDTALVALRNELLVIMSGFAVRGGPLHTGGAGDLCCTRAALLAGSEGGLSEDDAAAGYFTGGCELEFEY